MLKKCPECYSELKNDCFGEFQYCHICGYWTRMETRSISCVDTAKLDCHICGYWTRMETARLEPIIIFE